MEDIFKDPAYIGLRIRKETKIEFQKLMNKQGKSVSRGIREMIERRVSTAKKRGAL